MKKFLFEHTDNAPLVLFRIFLGLLLACETAGAILTGWVRDNFITPGFTFSHIGMEWLQPLPGNGMYYYFGFMAVLGLLVMIGYKYRLSISLFTIMWAAVYFMQKTSYNNHYYLLMLVCLMMCFLPANAYASVDARLKPEIKRYSMPRWYSAVMVAQVAIVYFFATVAKFYPDWLNGTFAQNLLRHNVTLSGFKEIMTSHPFALFIAWSGIVFDFLIIPLMLWKRTRTLAFIASLIFHIFNSITLKIGIFPFFALSFAVFLYPPETIRKIFFKRKPRLFETLKTDNGINTLRYFFIPYLIIQLLLPLRHHLIKGDVLWTEEGHRLSWRMMLRSRSGYTRFIVRDKKNGERLAYNPDMGLTQKQRLVMETHPDMIWQMAQRIKKDYAAKGINVSVHVNSRAAINSGPSYVLINPDTDLAAAKWNYFFHCPWILLYDNAGKQLK